MADFYVQQALFQKCCLFMDISSQQGPGADPGSFLGGGALVSCSTSTPINQIVFFLIDEVLDFIKLLLIAVYRT